MKMIGIDKVHNKKCKSNKIWKFNILWMYKILFKYSPKLKVNSLSNDLLNICLLSIMSDINELIKGHKNVSMYIKEWNHKLPLEYFDQELIFEFSTSFPVSSAVCRLWLVVRQICLSVAYLLSQICVVFLSEVLYLSLTTALALYLLNSTENSV